MLRIEVTTTLTLDTAEERNRLNTLFTGAKQELLLSILTRFEKGEFEALVDECTSWPKGLAEHLHPVVYQVIEAEARRLPRGKSQTLPTAPTPVRTRYPQHRVVQRPDGSEEFHNPNDVRVQHNYALVVLLSLAQGLRKAAAQLAAVVAGTATPKDVQEFLVRQDALLQSAARVEKQLLD